MEKYITRKPRKQQEDDEITQEVQDIQMDVVMEDDTEVIQQIIEDDKQEEFKDWNPNQYIKLPNSDQDNWIKVKSLLELAKEENHLHELYKIIQEIVKVLDNLPDDKFVIIKSLNIISDNKSTDDNVLEIVHFIADLALRVDTLFPTGEMRYLRRYNSEFISFSSEQCAWILALGFFCWLIPADRRTQLPYPVNFIQWYTERLPIYKEKLHFYIAYFAEFQKEDKLARDGETVYRTLSFERHSLKNSEYERLDDDFWCWNDMLLRDVEITDEGILDQDKKHNTVLTDFANRFMGGGAMRKGAVQEEILFLEFPELVLSAAVWAKMEKWEAIVITGVKQYSDHTGYSNKTKFAGTVEDK